MTLLHSSKTPSATSVAFAAASAPLGRRRFLFPVALFMAPTIDDATHNKKVTLLTKTGGKHS